MAFELQRQIPDCQQVVTIAVSTVRPLVRFKKGSTRSPTEMPAIHHGELCAVAMNAERSKHPSLECLRSHVNTRITHRLARSRASLAMLRAVVERGLDVQHAAHCVQLAHELDVHGDGYFPDRACPDFSNT
jgi:hypothetical protein